MPIEPVTHLEKTIAGTVEPVTHLEKVIEQYGGGGGGGGSVTVDAALSETSENPVQNKVITSKINQMDRQLGELDTWLGDKLDAPIVVTVSGSDVTITPVDNRIYNCGEVASLTISNPPVPGLYSIVFTSGATATVTTFPATILGLEDFAAETNTIYEINVLNNRAVIGKWAVSV